MHDAKMSLFFKKRKLQYELDGCNICAFAIQSQKSCIIKICQMYKSSFCMTFFIFSKSQRLSLRVYNFAAMMHITRSIGFHII